MFTPRQFARNTTNASILLIASAFLANPTYANPASDRAFGNCMTAAAAYLETRGHQVGAVTVLAREAGQHRIRITPAAPDAEPSAIICTASRQTTAIEVVSTRLALGSPTR